MANRSERYFSELTVTTRTPGRVDRDRILYSRYFRRLSGITQVMSPLEGQMTRNRLTHTLEVARVGRDLADKLLQADKELSDAHGGVDPDVVEAACLAHDLGHPPFGHVAESELDTLCKQQMSWDGFEGNAQSFRIVTRLADSESEEGLNLTRATLNALLKYPWLRVPAGPKSLKWGAYVSEEDLLSFARIGNFHGPRSLEADVMDWADDVAYAVHDVEDFFIAGFIPLDQLVRLGPEYDRFLAGVQQRWSAKGELSNGRMDDAAAAFERLILWSPIIEPYRGDLLTRRRLATYLGILRQRFIEGFELSDDLTTGSHSHVDKTVRTEVDMMKELIWHYVILRQSLAGQQAGQRRVIRELFSEFLEAVNGSVRLSVFPPEYRERLEVLQADAKEAKVRVVADLLASMTEGQIIRLHQRIMGTNPGSIFDPVFV